MKFAFDKLLHADARRRRAAYATSCVKRVLACTRDPTRQVGVAQVPFMCPECSTPKALKTISTIELPPDSRSDEITLQVVECSQCGFAGIAVYGESRRGAFGTESIDHRGYRVSAEDVKRVRKTIVRCPEPRNSRCKCPAHRELSRRNASARWNALDDILRREASFQLWL